MPDSKKNFRPGGARRPFSSGPKRFGQQGRSFPQREMYAAECSNCHKPTQVPFRPNGKKPVYCKDCFVPEAGQDRAPCFERRPMLGRPEPFAAPQKDARIDEVLRRLDSMERTLEKLSSMLENSNRKEALAEEVRKHLPKTANAASKATVKKLRKTKKP